MGDSKFPCRMARNNESLSQLIAGERVTNHRTTISKMDEFESLRISSRAERFRCGPSKIAPFLSIVFPRVYTLTKWHSRRFLILLRAYLETTRGAAAMDFGCGQGGEFRASPQRAVRNESTPATDKRPAARRVFGEKAVWLRPARECFRSCSVVAVRSASFVAPSGLFPENSAPRSFQTGSK